MFKPVMMMIDVKHDLTAASFVKKDCLFFEAFVCQVIQFYQLWHLCQIFLTALFFGVRP